MISRRKRRDSSKTGKTEPLSQITTSQVQSARENIADEMQWSSGIGEANVRVGEVMNVPGEAQSKASKQIRTSPIPATPKQRLTPARPHIVNILQALALLTPESCSVIEETMPLSSVLNQETDDEAANAATFTDLVSQAALKESDHIAVLTMDEYITNEAEKCTCTAICTEGAAIACLFDLQQRYGKDGDKKSSKYKDIGIRGLQLTFDAGLDMTGGHDRPLVGVFTLVLDCSPRGQQLTSSTFPATCHRSLKSWLSISPSSTETRRFTSRDPVIEACVHRRGKSKCQWNSSLFTASSRPSTVRLKILPKSLSTVPVYNNRRLMLQMIQNTIAPLLQWRIARVKLINLLSLSKRLFQDHVRQ